MAICAMCGKKPQFGNTRSFSMRATRRKFNPNLQVVKMKEGDKFVRKTLCTKCLKSLSKN